MRNRSARSGSRLVVSAFVGALALSVHAAEPEVALDASALRAAPPGPPLEAVLVTASDGARLAVYPFLADEPRARLVFYHGGGAHSLAGYGFLAASLQRDYGVSTFLVDIRGHGRSDGERGDAASAQRVWDDVRDVLAWVRARDAKEGRPVPLLLGGHSSGAGLVLNVLGRDDPPAVDAVVFIAPELGPNADTKRDGPDAFRFADVDVWKFVLNGVSGGSLCGHCRAVHFRHPAGAEEAGLVDGYSVNMALAVSPQDPAAQVARVAGPFGVWLSEADELLDPAKLTAFLEESASDSSALEVTVLPGASHLSILTRVADAIGPWVAELRVGERPPR